MDRYANFVALQTEQIEGQDFRVRIVPRIGAKIAVLAPHGGAIEPGTSELAIAIAGEDLGFAIFEGIKLQQNRDLHLTSIHFDEPRCIDVITKAYKVITLHGESNNAPIVFIGGGDLRLRALLKNSLTEAGFCVRVHQNAGLQGVSPENICNRGISGSGVQLELSRGLRAILFGSLQTTKNTNLTRSFHLFVAAVRRGFRFAGLL